VSALLFCLGAVAAAVLYIFDQRAEAREERRREKRQAR
jgi:hypothetical protein